MLSRNVIVEEADFVDQPVDKVIEDGERAIYGEGQPQPETRRRGPHPKDCKCGRCKWSRPAQAAPQVVDPAKVAMLGKMFEVTGRVVFNQMMQLEPDFSPESGRLLAEAWSPVMEAYTASPLTIAITVTVGVSIPYLLQLAVKAAEKERTKREAREFAQNITGAGVSR